MNLMQLRYFLKTAELLNYSRAADEMLVARQSLRQSIAGLEDEIGKPLFENRKNKLSLTEYGAYLYVAGQKAVAAFDEMQQGLSRLIGKSTRLRVGFSVSLFPFILADTDIILRAFRARFPDIELEVVQLENDAIIEAVMAGEVDAGCVMQLPCERKNSVMYRLTEFEVALDYSDPMTFGGWRHVTLRDLAGVPCLGMGSLQITMQPLWEACREAGVSFPYQVSPDTLDAFYQMKHGAAVGFDILKTNVPEFEWDRTSVLDGFQWEVGFLCSKQSREPSVLTLFCQFMEQEYRLRWEQYDQDFASASAGLTNGQPSG